MTNQVNGNSGMALSSNSDRVTLLLSEINEKLTKQNLNEKEWLSIDELSLLIGIPKASIYKMTSKGTIPFVKIGKHLRFIRPEILKWIKSKQNVILN
jgi:excisionase family DNA binding protein